MGAASEHRGFAHYELSEGKAFVAADVTKFLGNLKSKYSPNKPFSVFWDNCKIHKAKIVKQWLDQ